MSSTKCFRFPFGCLYIPPKINPFIWNSKLINIDSKSHFEQWHDLHIDVLSTILTTYSDVRAYGGLVRDFFLCQTKSKGSRKMRLLVSLEEQPPGSIRFHLKPQLAQLGSHEILSRARTDSLVRPVKSVKLRIRHLTHQANRQVRRNNIIFVWRRQENVSPGTAIRTNTNYQRIASCAGYQLRTP